MSEPTQDLNQAPFIWKGNELKTLGDIMDAVDACATAEQTRELRDAYRAVNQWADDNLGYLTGYYDERRGAELREWMQVQHPIFGSNTPTAEQAFAAGVESGSQS